MHIDIGREGGGVYEVYNLSPCVLVSNGTWCSAPCGHVRSGAVQQYYPHPASQAKPSRAREEKEGGKISV